MSDSTRSSMASRSGVRYAVGALGSVAIHLALFALLLRPIHAAPVPPVAFTKHKSPDPAMSCDFPATPPQPLRAAAATSEATQFLRVRDRVLLDVRIAHDGTPVDVRVLSGSGDAYLDQIALCSTLRRNYVPPKGLAWLGADWRLIPVAFPSEPR